MQPEVRLKTHELIPSCFVQENFGMSEGMYMNSMMDALEYGMTMPSGYIPSWPRDLILHDTRANIILDRIDDAIRCGR